MTEKGEVARSAEMEQRDFRIRYHIADSEGAAWKQYWLARACDVLDDATAVADQFGVPNRNALERIERYVCEAAETLKEGKARSVQWFRRADRERAIACIHLAELEFLRSAPLGVVRGRLPHLVAVCRVEEKSVVGPVTWENVAV